MPSDEYNLIKKKLMELKRSFFRFPHSDSVLRIIQRDVCNAEESYRNLGFLPCGWLIVDPSCFDYYFDFSDMISVSLGLNKNSV